MKKGKEKTKPVKLYFVKLNDSIATCPFTGKHLVAPYAKQSKNKLKYKMRLLNKECNDILDGYKIGVLSEVAN